MSPSSFNTLILHQLVARIRDGDRAAQDQLVRSIAARVERIARAMLRDFPAVRRWADTNDVFQNSIMRLLAALRQVRPASTRDFFRLATAEVRRELLDLVRYVTAHCRDDQRLAQPDPAGDEPLAEVVDPGNGPEMLDAWQRFHEAVGSLPEEEGETFSLVFYHGWSREQVGEVLGVTPQTVGRYWRSACRRLRDALGPVADDLLN